MGNYVTMRRKALIRVSTREGIAAACGHSTKHSTGRRRRNPGQTAARTPPAAHSPSRKSTPHYTIGYSTPAERGGGALRYCKGWGGVLAQPRWMNGTPGQKRVSKGRSMHKEALGDFNQALATRGRTGGLGSGLHREEMAPGKVKDRGLGSAGAPRRSPDPGLRLSVHLVPALAPCLPNPGTKNGLAGPPFLLGPH